VNAATNVFIEQVVGAELVCSETSGADHLQVEERFAVKIKRNLKGRGEGMVVLQQPTDDMAQFGPDGRDPDRPDAALDALERPPRRLRRPQADQGQQGGA